MLFEPEIPQNTGNIVRTCAATGMNLHLIKPLGFSVEDRYLKRAGLDYWYLVNISYYENLEDFFSKNNNILCYYVTTKGKKRHDEVIYKNNCFLMFGKETAGLPKELLEINRNYCIRIPMINEARSLNLSNSVSIVAYEALRQLDFPNMI